jgi:hypothetical protein
MSGVAQPHPDLNMANILTRNNMDDFYGALGADPNSTREQIVAEFKARVRVRRLPQNIFIFLLSLLLLLLLLLFVGLLQHNSYQVTILLILFCQIKINQQILFN